MLKIIALTLLLFQLAYTSVFSQSAVEKEVGSRVEALRKAMLTPDTAALVEITAKELSYGHSSGLVEDQAAFVNEFVTGKTVFKSLVLSDQTIKIVDNVAIVRHHFAGDTNNNNVPGKVELVILLIWQKQEGNWKLLARQAAKIPVVLK